MKLEVAKKVSLRPESLMKVISLPGGSIGGATATPLGFGQCGGSTGCSLLIVAEGRLGFWLLERLISTPSWGGSNIAALNARKYHNIAKLISNDNFSEKLINMDSLF